MTLPRQPVLSRIKTVLFAAAVLRDAAEDLSICVDQGTGIANEATDAQLEARTILGRLLDAARIEGFTAEELGVETLRPFEDIDDAHV